MNNSNANSADNKTRFIALLTTAMLVSALSAASLASLVQTALANTCPPRTCVDGRMTGGGKLAIAGNEHGTTQVTHGFELYCNINNGPNNLQINWFDAAGNENHFHLESLISSNISIVCYDDPNAIQKPPTAPLDTFQAQGIGKLNGVDGATIYFELKDAGEPGSSDWTSFVIEDADGNEVLHVNGLLNQGNHQAHKVNK